jgi:hypothetical protein
LKAKRTRDVFYLPETIPEERFLSLHVSFVLQNYS